MSTDMTIVIPGSDSSLLGRCAALTGKDFFD